MGFRLKPSGPVKVLCLVFNGREICKVLSIAVIFADQCCVYFGSEQ